MAWEVEYTDEFGDWWTAALDETQQEDLRAYVVLLQESEQQQWFPFSSKISGSRHGHMCELRADSSGVPLRVFYALDRHRRAILLIGGDKTGNDRFYAEYLPIADQLYDAQLALLVQENEED
jgi:hypothetical protein